MVTDVLIVFALVVSHGMFAGAEIAVVSLRRTRLHQLVDEGSRAARAVEQLRSSPERFLATVQIGITLIGTSLAAFGVPTFAGVLRPLLGNIPLLVPYTETIAVAFGVAVISYLELVLAELVPKSLALRSAEGFSLLVGRPLLALSSVARPAVWLLEGSSNVFLRLFGDRTTFNESRLSPEEIRQALEDAGRAQSIQPEASSIAVRALDLAGLNAADVMVPRNRVLALPRTASTDELKNAFLVGGHQRLPVFDDNLDHVRGYVAAKDVLETTLIGGPLTLEELMRPVTFFPESMKAVLVLEEMRKKHATIAVLVDERGGMAGLVTIEDLVEELVGEIFSEDGRGAPAAVRVRPDGSAWVLGATPIREVNRALDTSLPEGELWATIAGYLIKLAGRIPPAGERVVTEDGTILEVIESTPRRIRTIRLIKSPDREKVTHA